MYSEQLVERIIKLMAPHGYTPRTESEAQYPSRALPEGAIITRAAPSPTGFVHIGTIYMSVINKLVALNTKGIHYLRIEDTDKKREVTDGVKEIVSVLEKFDLKAQEGVDELGKSYGQYGPYMQSQRAEIYLGYAFDLLKEGRAYICFATKEELEANYKRQQTEKVRPGYYGKWAIWRNKSEDEVLAALDSNKPFVLRFKSEGAHDKRLRLQDLLKGSLELPENDLDVPLIKSDEYRLPTYHLAHVVDDFLMKTTVILRGDEWLPSTPLHIELSQALGIKPFKYAHFAPINIMDGSSKRKLSKRKDPEADTKYFLADGYPTVAVLEYLVRLANSNFEDWRHNNPAKSLWDFPFSFEKWSKARGALLDIKKLEDVSKNYIAELKQDIFVKSILSWAKEYAVHFYKVLTTDLDYTNKVLMIERQGERKRKDIAKWSQSLEEYGYFYDEIFTPQFRERAESELLGDIDQKTISHVANSILAVFEAKDNQTEWFEKFKKAADECGFASDGQLYKQNPGNFKGSLADFAKIIRVKLCARNRTPDLYLVMSVMGNDRVRRRLKA